MLALTLVFCLFVSADNVQAQTFEDVSARAAAARDANDLPAAISLYAQAVQLNPKWEEGWWYLGTLFYDADQYQQGQEALQRLTQLNPNLPLAWATLGLCEFETGVYLQSLSDIQRAISLGADKEARFGDVLLYHQALLLTREGDFDKALQAWSGLLKRDKISAAMVPDVGLAALRTPLLPKDIPAPQKELFFLAGKAQLYGMGGDLKTAGQTLDQLVQHFPAAANVHYLYGSLLIESDPDLAILEFKRELDVAPANAQAGGMLAWILFRRGDYAAALPYALKAVESDPKSPLTQVVAGRVLVETGSVEKGIEHLETAEKLEPSNLEAHLALVTAYSRIGRTEDARRERHTSLAMRKDPQVAQR